MADLYANINISVPAEEIVSDNIEDKNVFPDNVKNPEQIITPPQDKQITTVDFLQIHPHADNFLPTDGTFSMYDPTNPDRQLFDIMEQETITISSPPIKYYRLRKNQTNIDPLYGEATRRDAFDNPVTIFGSYEDPSPIMELNKYGITQPEELDIFFNLNYLMNKLGKYTYGLDGKPIQVGDILMSYDGKLWEVRTAVIIDEDLWRAIHLSVRAERVQASGIYLPDIQGAEVFPILD